MFPKIETRTVGDIDPVSLPTHLAPMDTRTALKQMLDRLDGVKATQFQKEGKIGAKAVAVGRHGTAPRHALSEMTQQIEALIQEIRWWEER